MPEVRRIRAASTGEVGRVGIEFRV